MIKAQQVNWRLGNLLSLGLLAFALTGAVLAAFLYAMFHTIITIYIGGTIATISGLVLMVSVLIIKPTGIMGVKVSE